MWVSCGEQYFPIDQMKPSQEEWQKLVFKRKNCSVPEKLSFLPICLFLGKYCSQSLLRSICSSCSEQRLGWGCSCRLVSKPERLLGHLQKAMLAVTIYWLSPWPGAHSMAGQSMWSLLWIACNGLQGQEGRNLHIGLQWHTLSNGF